MCLSNVASSSAADCAEYSACLQLPQVGALPSWSARTRLVVWQCGQTMCSDSVMEWRLGPSVNFSSTTPGRVARCILHVREGQISDAAWCPHARARLKVASRLSQNCGWFFVRLKACPWYQPGFSMCLQPFALALRDLWYKSWHRAQAGV